MFLFVQIQKVGKGGILFVKIYEISENLALNRVCNQTRYLGI